MHLDVEYVLPLRWSGDVSRRDAGELTDYLRRLSRLVDVTVVDGSDAATFRRHHDLWSTDVRHLSPEPWPGRNGKVAGVVTGVRRARHERVVLADDDVRYDDASLRAVVAGLDDGELVRPQNVFTSWPWHARWDTGRSLLNRAVSHDHPGTFGVRRSCFVAMGGYDGDVLFENLELTRTVALLRRPGRRPARRLRRPHPPGRRPLLVPAGAPGVRRPRAAHTPARWSCLCCHWPLWGSCGGRDRCWPARWLPCWWPRRDVDARAARRPTRGRPPVWALPWLGERSVCIWLALAQVPRGGAPYAGGRVRRAATPARRLRSGARQPLEGDPDRSGADGVGVTPAVGSLEPSA